MSNRSNKCPDCQAYGGCTKCYGKGYASYASHEIGGEDFGGEGYVRFRPRGVHLCTCDRGKQLHKVLQDEYERGVKDGKHIQMEMRRMTP